MQGEGVQDKLVHHAVGALPGQLDLPCITEVHAWPPNGEFGVKRVRMRNLKVFNRRLQPAAQTTKLHLDSQHVARPRVLHPHEADVYEADVGSFRRPIRNNLAGPNTQVVEEVGQFTNPDGVLLF